MRKRIDDFDKIDTYTVLLGELIIIIMHMAQHVMNFQVHHAMSD